MAKCVHDVSLESICPWCREEVENEAHYDLLCDALDAFIMIAEGTVPGAGNMKEYAAQTYNRITDELVRLRRKWHLDFNEEAYQANRENDILKAK